MLPTASIPVLTVSALTAILKEIVETALPVVWVSGEISNCTTAGSGHYYLTLKDDAAQLKAVIWRGVAVKLRFKPEEGLAVIARGHLDLYPPRGTYQLVIEELHPRGIGAAELALRKLKDKLSAEGLFDAAHKKPLPSFPRRIGIVTSPSGAAVRDFLEVLRRRWRGTQVLVLPARVQGDGAAAEIAAAIGRANALAEPLDLLVVARGGGSSEDLAAFNDERVVRAIFASRVPIISAVGHEIDVTLSDLAADVRALTPSEAAERAVPAGEELAARLAELRERFRSGLDWRAQTLRRRLELLANRPAFRRPLDRVLQKALELDQWSARAARAIRNRWGQCRRELAARATQLDALSPLQILGRGYSLTTRSGTDELISFADQVAMGEEIVTRLVRGRIVSRVERTIGENELTQGGASR